MELLLGIVGIIAELIAIINMKKILYFLGLSKEEPEESKAAPGYLLTVVAIFIPLLVFLGFIIHLSKGGHQ